MHGSEILMLLDMPLFRLTVTPLAVARINRALFLPPQSVNSKSKVKETFQWKTSEILMPLDMALFRPMVMLVVVAPFLPRQSVNSKSLNILISQN